MTQCLAGMIAGMIAAGATWADLPQIQPALVQEGQATAFILPRQLAGNVWMQLLGTVSASASSRPTSPAQKAIAIQVKLDPEWPGWEGVTLVSSTNEYCGESSARGKESNLRMAISGTIQRISEKKSLISYDLEIRLTDKTGVTRLSAAGSGLFAYGKPTDIITMAGRKVILTATLVEGLAEAPR